MFTRGLQTGFVYATKGNQELYRRPNEFLEGDIYFGSTVIRTTRGNNGVTAVV